MIEKVQGLSGTNLLNVSLPIQEDGRLLSHRFFSTSSIDPKAPNVALINGTASLAAGSPPYAFPAGKKLAVSASSTDSSITFS